MDGRWFLGVFRRSLPSDIEWQALKFVPLQEVFVLHAVSTCVNERVRRTLVSHPWDVVLTCKSAGVAFRSLEELCNADAIIRSVSLVRVMVHFLCAVSAGKWPYH